MRLNVSLPENDSAPEWLQFTPKELILHGSKLALHREDVNWEVGFEEQKVYIVIYCIWTSPFFRAFSIRAFGFGALSRAMFMVLTMLRYAKILRKTTNQKNILHKVLPLRMVDISQSSIMVRDPFANIVIIVFFVPE